MAAFVFGYDLSSFTSSRDAPAIFVEVGDLNARLEEEVDKSDPVLWFLPNLGQRRRRNLRSDGNRRPPPCPLVRLPWLRLGTKAMWLY